MIKSVKQFIKQYLNFSKRDRNGVLLLCLLIFLTIVANLIVDNIQPKSRHDYSEFEKLFVEWKKNQVIGDNHRQVLFAFNPNTILETELDSLNIPEFVKRNILNYRSANGKFSTSTDVRKIYGMNDSIFAAIEKYIEIPKESAFKIKPVKESNKVNLILSFIDPNLSDFNELVKFGFNRFQANNIVKYREKGGTFTSKIDLLKIYGIDSLFYETIEGQIQITEVKVELPMENIPVPFSVELNSADSLSLVKLNGIGPVYASRILKYRNLLGGYCSTEQLLEVYSFPEETYLKIADYLNVDTTLVKKIRINFADYPELLKHPYINKKFVEAILAFRNKNGEFLSIKQIGEINFTDSVAFNKIEPYLTIQ